jgi:hypothetical protein
MLVVPIAVLAVTAVLHVAGGTVVLVGATRLTVVVDMLLGVGLLPCLGRRAMFHDVASSGHLGTYTPHRYRCNHLPPPIIPATGKEIR